MRLKLDSESRDRLGLSVDVLGLVHDAAHLYTTGLEHLADQRDGHCVGAHAVAGDAASGVGSAHEGGMLIGVSENRAKRMKLFGFVLMVCGIIVAIGPVVGYFLMVLISPLVYLSSLLWEVYMPVGTGIFFLGKWLHDTHVLPSQLRMGDRLADDGGQWVVLSQPHTSVGGRWSMRESTE